MGGARPLAGETGMAVVQNKKEGQKGGAGGAETWREFTSEHRGTLEDAEGVPNKGSAFDQ